MNSIPSRKMGTYHTLYPPAAAIALARAALAPSSARVASPSSSTMCADARYLQPREAWREAWARGREDARGGRAPPPPPPPPARALRRTNASIVAIVHAPSPARRLTRHLCSSFGREDGPRARRGRGRGAGPRRGRGEAAHRSHRWAASGAHVGASSGNWRIAKRKKTAASNHVSGSAAYVSACTSSSSSSRDAPPSSLRSHAPRTSSR